MKTSNKILSGVFLLGIFTTVGVHVALYAKYKAGDFAPKEEVDAKTYSEQALPASLKAVSITGLSNCSVTTVGKAALKYNKESNVQLSSTIKNDTLYLAANTWAQTKDYENGTRNHQYVTLTLPENLPVTLQYGSLVLRGASDTTHAPSYHVALGKHAHLGIMHRETEEAPTWFNRIQVVSTLSSVELDDQTFINELDVKATESYLNYKKATVNRLHMDVDDKTTINASKNSLNNLNLTPKQ